MQKIFVEGLGDFRFDKLVAVFSIWTGDRLPIIAFEIRVWQREGDFQASPNVAIRNPATGYPEHIGGLGDTVENSLADCLANVFSQIHQLRPDGELLETDFVWSDSEDF